MISTMEPKVTLIVEEVDASSEKSTVDQLRLIETLIENHIGILYLYTMQRKDPSKKHPRVLGPGDLGNASANAVTFHCMQ